MLTPTAELLLANVKTNGPLISDPAGLLAVLFSVLAIIF